MANGIPNDVQFLMKRPSFFKVRPSRQHTRILPKITENENERSMSDDDLSTSSSEIDAEGQRKPETSLDDADSLLTPANCEHTGNISNDNDNDNDGENDTDITNNADDDDDIIVNKQLKDKNENNDVDIIANFQERNGGKKPKQVCDQLTEYRKDLYKGSNIIPLGSQFNTAQTYQQQQQFGFTSKYYQNGRTSNAQKAKY